MTERTYVIRLNTPITIIEYFQIMLSFQPYVILHMKRLVERDGSKSQRTEMLYSYS